MSKVIKGFSWNFITQAYKVLFSSLVLIILARLISVEDFGVIGMAMVFVLFFNTIQNIGFDSSIIYSKNFKEKHLLSLFLLNIVLGFLIYLAGYFLSPFLSYFYDNKEIQVIFRSLVLTVIFSSFGIVSKGYLQKKLNFKKLAIIEIIAITIAGTTAVFLALKNFGYWSLIVQQLVTAGLTSFGFILITFKIMLKERYFSFNIIREHLQFGYNVFIFNVFNFFAQQLDVLLIGKLLGEKQVGIYLLAFNLVLKPVSLLVQVFNKTVYPVLTRIKFPELKDSYTKLTSSFFLFLAPLIIFFVAISQILIPELLTDKWLETLPLLIIFGYQSVRMIIASPSGLLFLITGNPNKQWKFAVFISFPLRLTGVLLGYYFYKSALGVALGINLFATIEMLIGFFIAFKLIDLKMDAYFAFFTNTFFQLSLLTLTLVGLNYFITTYLFLLLLQIIVIILYVILIRNRIIENIKNIRDII
ncbi:MULTISPECIES: oligosaccharide flippase family protein [unclassified Polaribacter]|uniref:oligosaccharide flippase family protein n=1 Tax=unclassified Polaribacter TaxID=196858 RepID=UPI0011BDD888|nr:MULTISPECIES: oligosaccharide flippase family protein [unclassified Polaribacter]TXD54237.1 oligosaccharide flippase family protein [Polaribacter sp. IC063]TXD57121.1 oligosaccharide flippase family protein [Polaribacter sp. IC066]